MNSKTLIVFDYSGTLSLDAVLFAQARKIAAPEIPDRQIAQSVDRFIAVYLHSSRIDPDWKPVLKQLSRTPTVTVIIATDHYAEATGYIMSCLEDMDIAGVSIVDVPVNHDAASFYIANSAEIRAVKA